MFSLAYKKTYLYLYVQIHKYSLIYVKHKYFLEGLGIYFPIRAKQTKQVKCDDAHVRLESTLHRIRAKAYKTTMIELSRPAGKTKPRSPLIYSCTDLKKTLISGNYMWMWQ